MIVVGTVRREAFFLDAPDRRLFSLATLPKDASGGGLLYVHPFAEEMNKSRRMATLQSCALAEHGWTVLQVDLTGCGDSSHDFGDATWSVWLDDMSLAWDWLVRRCEGLHGIWSLRAGALLTTAWISREQIYPPLLFWQPVTNGEQHLTQFLRLKAANEMLNASENRGVVSGLREQLRGGESVEVAGYRLRSELAEGLESASLDIPESYPSAVSIFEISNSERREPSPRIRKLVDKWSSTGNGITCDVVRGPGFWQTLEIEVAPELVQASLEAVSRWVP